MAETTMWEIEQKSTTKGGGRNSLLLYDTSVQLIQEHEKYFHAKCSPSRSVQLRVIVTNANIGGRHAQIYCRLESTSGDLLVENCILAPDGSSMLSAEQLFFKGDETNITIVVTYYPNVINSKVGVPYTYFNESSMSQEHLILGDSDESYVYRITINGNDR